MFQSLLSLQNAGFAGLGRLFRAGMVVLTFCAMSSCGLVNRVDIAPLTAGNAPLTMSSDEPMLVAYEEVEPSPIEQAKTVCRGEAEYIYTLPPTRECKTNAVYYAWETRTTECIVTPGAQRKGFSSDKYTACLAKYGWKLEPRAGAREIEAELFNIVREDQADKLDMLLGELSESAQGNANSGFDLDGKNSLGRTLLHSAVYFGAINSVKVLLKRGAAVDAPDDLRETPLHIAARDNSVDIAALLLENDAWVDAKATMLSLYSGQYRSGVTPLHYAAAHNFREMAELLVKHGANLQSTVANYPNTKPSGFASRNGHSGLASWLKSME